MEKTMSFIVEGGKATPAPPLGPALAQLGLNIGKVIAEINKATGSFQGMKVPIKVIVDTTTKEFRIEVGTPSVSEMLKKVAKIEKGGSDQKQPVANISLKDVIEIAKKKMSSSKAKGLKNVTKEILGTCLSMGITVEGKNPKEVQREIDEGKYDSLFVS